MTTPFVSQAEFTKIDEATLAHRRARMAEMGARIRRKSAELSAIEAVLTALESGVSEPMTVEEVARKLG